MALVTYINKKDPYNKIVNVNQGSFSHGCYTHNYT